MSQECNRSHTSAPWYWFPLLFVVAVVLFFGIYTGPASRVSQNSQERAYEHELKLARVQSGVVYASEAEQEQQLSELEVRSMPFWGQVHVANAELRSELRRVNEVVRNEALFWRIRQGTSIRITDMTSQWLTDGTYMVFVVTSYYVEEEQ